VSKTGGKNKTSLFSMDFVKGDFRIYTTQLLRHTVIRLLMGSPSVPFAVFLHTYIPLRLIPEGVAEASQIVPRDPKFYQNYLAMRITAEVTDNKLIAVIIPHLRCECC
jgi:hypothetical protein